jgi:unsaturated chondroitin disaccharide hydrolase
LSHRYTGETRYLEASLRLARKFIDQLDDEFIPGWDFRLPAGAPKLRDSSAAAITVCGLQELMNLHAADPQLASTAKLLLARLCSDTYLDQDENVPGLLKNAQAGFSEHMAINCYSSWGDYFLTEALSRELRGSGTFW